MITAFILFIETRMVNRCCVPGCHNIRGKSKEASFHEFPADSELRSKWINNISRRDWAPKDRSVVCSKHFIKEAYKCGSKRRILKVTSFPTEFCHYSLNTQNGESKPNPVEADISVVHTNDSVTAQTNTPEEAVTSALHTNDIIPVEADTPEEAVTSTLHTNDIVPVEANTPEEAVTSALHTNGIAPVEADTPEEKEAVTSVLYTIDVVRVEGNTPEGDTSQCLYPKPKKRASCTSESKRGRPFDPPEIVRKKLRLYYNSWKRFHKQVKDLKYQLKKLKEKEEELEEKLSKWESIENDALLGERGAIFLNEQIHSYGKKKRPWSKAVIRECIVFRARSPKGYEYARERGLLHLPSRKTLRNYSEYVSDEDLDLVRDGLSPSGKQVSKQLTTSANGSLPHTARHISESDEEPTSNTSSEGVELESVKLEPNVKLKSVKQEPDVEPVCELNEAQSVELTLGLTEDPEVKLKRISSPQDWVPESVEKACQQPFQDFFVDQ